MRVIFHVIVAIIAFSCNLSAKKNIPSVRQAMPSGWYLLKYEEEFLPYKGYSFDPVFISTPDELKSLLQWKGADTGYQAVLDFSRYNYIASYREEHTGNFRYSLWASLQGNKIAIRKEDLSTYMYEKRLSPSYIYFYKLPRTTVKYTVESY